MRKRGIVRAAPALVNLALLLLQETPPAFARAREFQVLLHFRNPDGREETVSAGNFRFVYYDRRYIHHPRGIGEKGELEIRDLPREVRSLQDENLKHLRFAKLGKVRFDYRPEGGKDHLRMLATWKSRRRKPVDWPGDYLRNANTARLPHFRAIVDGREKDIPLPPYLRPASATEPILVQIDFLAAQRRR
jgi:hypothetical protein